MRISIATCEDRVCPRFDRAATLLVIDIRGEQEQNREVLDISTWPAHGRAARLAELGIDHLVCGALSSFDEAGFEDSRVRLVSRVAGPVDAVIHAVLSGTIVPGRDCSRDRSDARARELQRPHGTQKSEPVEPGKETDGKGPESTNHQKG
jgi:predicted Fe-Mo cluster-binding NifX family protein